MGCVLFGIVFVLVCCLCLCFVDLVVVVVLWLLLLVDLLSFLTACFLFGYLLIVWCLAFVFCVCYLRIWLELLILGVYSLLLFAYCVLVVLIAWIGWLVLLDCLMFMLWFVFVFDLISGVELDLCFAFSGCFDWC